MEMERVNSPDGLIPTASLRRLLDFLQGHWDTAEEQIHPVATFSWHQNMDRMEIAGITLVETGETLRLRAQKMCFVLWY
jgi:hypothetical protein